MQLTNSRSVTFGLEGSLRAPCLAIRASSNSLCASSMNARITTRGAPSDIDTHTTAVASIVGAAAGATTNRLIGNHVGVDHKKHMRKCGPKIGSVDGTVSRRFG